MRLRDFIGTIRIRFFSPLPTVHPFLLVHEVGLNIVKSNQARAATWTAPERPQSLGSSFQEARFAFI